MLDSVRNEVTRILMTVQIRSAGGCRGGRRAGGAAERAATSTPTTTRRWPEEEAEGADAAVATAPKPQPFVRQGEKVGRNDPCPCGSGKKYKQCHGRLA